MISTSTSVSAAVAVMTASWSRSTDASSLKHGTTSDRRMSSSSVYLRGVVPAVDPVLRGPTCAGPPPAALVEPIEQVRADLLARDAEAVHRPVGHARPRRAVQPVRQHHDGADAHLPQVGHAGLVR